MNSDVLDREVMMDTIVRLLEENGFGKVTSPISPVSGGLMHKMYKVDTQKGSFAVKHLNPNIMKRSEAMENYKKAEALERLLEDAGIPIVSAISVNGRKMLEFEENYFYVFHWQEGEITDWNHITTEQCRIAGTLQGRIHAIQSKIIAKPEPDVSNIDWKEYIREAAVKNQKVEGLLKENEDVLVYAQKELNQAREALPGIETIVDEDMDPKNVMWHEGESYVIDLECLDLGNPVSSALQLSLQWAGSVTGELDLQKIDAFFTGYFEAYDNGFRDYGKVFGLAYTWIEWLEYNIGRALGEGVDAAEKELGEAEVERTITRIRRLYEMEEAMKSYLNHWK